MIRGTTPTFKLILKDESVDLTQALNVYATFTQGNVLITKTADDLEIKANEVDVYLSQAETLQFKPDSYVEVQMNWTYVDGRRARTKINKISISKNLIGSVLK